jgi:hypothetical protein
MNSKLFGWSVGFGFVISVGLLTHACSVFGPPRIDEQGRVCETVTFADDGAAVEVCATPAAIQRVKDAASIRRNPTQ